MKACNGFELLETEVLWHCKKKRNSALHSNRWEGEWNLVPHVAVITPVLVGITMNGVQTTPPDHMKQYIAIKPTNKKNKKQCKMF